MISLLVMLIVLCIVIYAVYIVLGMITLPAPIKTLIYLLIACIVLIFLLNHFGLATDLGLK